MLMIYYLQLTCFRDVAFITFNKIYNTSNTAYIHTLLKTFTILYYRYNHWRQCDVHNCSYGPPKMEDADSGKN